MFVAYLYHKQIKKIMKKLKVLVLSMVAVLASGTLNAQAQEKGDVIIDAYVGYSLLGSVFKAVDTDNADDVKSTNLMPVGIRGEYMINDILSIGLDAFYTQNKLDYKQTSYDYLNGTSTVYNYALSRTKLATYITFNFHLLKNAEKADLGLTVGAGYKNVVWTDESDNPAYEGAALKNPIPVSFRMGATFRYYFTENFGANITASIGGPLVSGGLSFKF